MPLDDVVGRITPAGSGARRSAELRQQRLTKPPGSLGMLEELSVQLAGIFGTDRPDPRGKTLIVAAGDHGVVAQGVTAYPQEVTAQMVLNFLSGGAAVNAMARRAGVDLVIVDAGVASPLPDHPGLRVVAPARGTSDMTQGPAMTHEQAETCVVAGVELALEAAENGADIIGTGDMGIGNTTASSAIAAALTGAPPAETTGRGTGRNDRELANKIAVVERAIEVNRPDPGDGLDVLAKVGGFEIGVLAGVVLGGALARSSRRARRLHLRRCRPGRPQPLPERQGLHGRRPPFRGGRPSHSAVAHGTAAPARPGHEAGRGHRRGAGNGHRRGGIGVPVRDGAHTFEEAGVSDRDSESAGRQGD